MAKQLKEEYLKMITSGKHLLGDAVKIFNRDPETIRRWVRQKRQEINNIEMLNRLNEYLKEQGRGVEDLNELFID